MRGPLGFYENNLLAWKDTRKSFFTWQKIRRGRGVFATDDRSVMRFCLSDVRFFRRSGGLDRDVYGPVMGPRKPHFFMLPG